MDDLPSAPPNEAQVTPRTVDAAGLWFLAVTLGAAVFVIAVSGRWKPVIAFPFVTGCVLAGLGHWLRSVLESTESRWHSPYVSLLAALTTLAALLAAALQQPQPQLPENPLAKQLLAAVEQQAASESGESVWSNRREAWNRYVGLRYVTHSPGSNTLAALGEALLAAICAAILSRSRKVARWFQRGTTT